MTQEEKEQEIMDAFKIWTEDKGLQADNLIPLDLINFIYETIQTKGKGV